MSKMSRAFIDVRPGRDSSDDLFLDLLGPLCLRDAAGVDLTPRGRKSQGLLALVAVSPALRRSRSWLQDKLWSDRPQEQGSASLRQCLTEVRASLGRHVDCLMTDRGWVALDPARVHVLAERDQAELDDVEFLEGLDIRDAGVRTLGPRPTDAPCRASQPRARRAGHGRRTCRAGAVGNRSLDLRCRIGTSRWPLLPS